MAVVDTRFIPVPVLQSYFIDKLTGESLVAGEVTFYQDINRNNLKPVYQITGNPGSYTFVALPNPLELSSIGTFVDSFGNNIQPYFFPYDGTPETSTGVVDLYYLEVVSSDDQFQFNLMAQPFIPDLLSPSMNQTTIDFGSTPVSQSSFTIADTNISSTDQIIAQVAYVAPAGKQLDELEFDSLDLKCSAGAGSFTVLAIARSGNPVSLVSGKFVINYIVS